MLLIVDTNVPKTANGDQGQASSQCIDNCVRWIEEILLNRHTLCLDDDWHILEEYEKQLHSDGLPGAGNRFLRWVHLNWTNGARCRLVQITPQDIFGQSPFAEFPSDPAIAGFDLDDHKFVAVALANREVAPILNATDRDWWEYRSQLNANGVQIEFLCPDAMTDP